MSLADPLVIGAFSYSRLVDGVYRAAYSTADQPVDLILKNTLAPDSISSYLVELRANRNSTSLTPGAKDDVLRMMFQIKHPSKAFTPAEVRTYYDILVDFLSPTTFNRILLGER